MGLHDWHTSAVLGAIALVVWVTAFFWYFYGVGRMERKVHEILVWLRLSR